MAGALRRGALGLATGQHVSVLGQNGSGKTHLIRHLLELWSDARVYVIDTNGDDDEWRHGFATVNDVPSWLDRATK